MKSLTIDEISTLTKGEIEGDSSQILTGLETLELAAKTDVTFIRNKKYAHKWKDSNAVVGIINEEIELNPGENRVLIRVKDADLAMAVLLDVYKTETPVFDVDIHPTAIIHETAILGDSCKIGAGCYIGKDVVLGDKVVLYPNVTIMDRTEVGPHSVFWSGTVIREDTKIGSYCIFHSNVSIGADGFGYRPSADGQGLTKITHIGNVIIGNMVEIGANSCVDRGKFSATMIGDGCKIDNLVQIAHNCVLGRCCIMAGNSGLAGSVTLGDGVIIGGSASIKDHLTLHSGAVVGAGSGVMRDVPAGQTVLGYPAADAKEKLKEWVALRKLGRE